jgi:hypothetical protein
MSISVDLIAATGETVQAQLVRMQPRHIQDFENDWQEMLQDLNESDAFWNWAMKKRLSSINKRFEAYTIEYENLAQGLLWLETQWHCSLVNPDQRLVYVEAIASAPWNRGAL